MHAAEQKFIDFIHLKMHLSKMISKKIFFQIQYVNKSRLTICIIFFFFFGWVESMEVLVCAFSVDASVYCVL